MQIIMATGIVTFASLSIPCIVYSRTTMLEYDMLSPRSGRNKMSVLIRATTQSLNGLEVFRRSSVFVTSTMSANVPSIVLAHLCLSLSATGLVDTFYSIVFVEFFGFEPVQVFLLRIGNYLLAAVGTVINRMLSECIGRCWSSLLLFDHRHLLHWPLWVVSY